MAKSNLYDLMNKQINYEIYSAHIYLNMSCYCGAAGLNGFKHWFEIQYQEELAHAKGLINYLLSRGYRPVITNWDSTPDSEFTNILELVQVALLHEKTVTDRFNYMVGVARQENDYATELLLTWYVKEQVEEEASFEELIGKLKLVKDAGLYLLDQEMATRVFVDPTPTIK